MKKTITLTLFIVLLACAGVNAYSYGTLHFYSNFTNDDGTFIDNIEYASENGSLVGWDNGATGCYPSSKGYAYCSSSSKSYIDNTLIANENFTVMTFYSECIWHTTGDAVCAMGFDDGIYMWADTTIWEYRTTDTQYNTIPGSYYIADRLYGIYQKYNSSCVDCYMSYRVVDLTNGTTFEALNVDRSYDGSWNQFYSLRAYGNFSNFTAWEGDFDDNPIVNPAATTITEINFTSELPSQICGDGTICGPTDDTTPTFEITTSGTSSCKISDTNQIYANLTKECSDQGTSSHTCILPVNEALVLGGIDKVYIVCNGFPDAEEILVNLSAAGGGDLQSNATEAILDGISDSSGSSATTYTDQQVYIRYSNGTQKLATFDVIASLSNQRWLFNYYFNETDTLTGMPSIGTVVNVWENFSLTYNVIVEQVKDFIDSTIN